MTKDQCYSTGKAGKHINKRELDFHNENEVKFDKSSLRVNVMKASVHAQQERLLKSLQKPNTTGIVSEDVNGSNITIKFGNMFAPPKNHKGLTNRTSKKDSGKLQKSHKSETLNYVLPVENFSDFKVLIPQSKLQVVTDDGESMVMEPNSENTVSNESILRKHKANLDVIKLLKNQTEPTKWGQNAKSYIYYDNNKKFDIDKESGEVSYSPRLEKAKVGRITFRSVNNKPEIIPMIGRYLNIDPSCCFSGKIRVKHALKNYVSIKNTSPKRSISSRVVLRQLERGSYKSTTRAKFIIYTAKFGSFIERVPPGSEVVRNKIKRAYKDIEEESLQELRTQLPFTCAFDQSRLSVLTNSIVYIQELERRLKERLQILPLRKEEEIISEREKEITPIREKEIIRIREEKIEVEEIHSPHTFYTDTSMYDEMEPTQEVPDMSTTLTDIEQADDEIHDEIHEEVVVDDSGGNSPMTSLLHFPSPRSKNEEKSMIVDQCTMVWQDLFKVLYSSQENKNESLHHENPTLDYGDSVDAIPCFCMQRADENNNEVVPDSDQQFDVGYENDEEEFLEQQYFKESYLDGSMEEEGFQLNYTDVNLNSLSKKEKIDDEDGLQDKEWASPEIGFPITMETERSIMLSPMATSEFHMNH